MRLFNRKRRPFAGDLQVIDAIRAEGVDLGRPRTVEHFLYFPTEPAARQAAALLEQKGYRTQVEARTELDSWTTLASVEAVISAESITEQRELLTELAAAGEGEYDGWGTPL